MRKVCVVLFVGVFGLLAWPAHAQWCPGYVDLIAAQHYDVGDVNVSHDTETVTVEYVVTEPGYCLTETHLYLDPERPSKTAPGQFPWGDDELGCVTGYTENIPWANLGDQQPVWVAAHAVVCGAGADYVEFELGIDAETSSTDGRLSATFVQQSGSSSYWLITFNNGQELNGGTYPGWCVDTDHTISGTKNVYLVPSYVDDGYGAAVLNPEALVWVDNPDNLDLVNWIINQGYVGTLSPGGFGYYTYGDVQKAIWTLIDDSSDAAGLGSWNANRVLEIVTAAEMYGGGFVPTCGQVVAVLLVDGSGSIQTTIFQVTFFELGLPCVPTGMCETAWGAGEQIRPGKNWAMTFRYEEGPAPEPTTLLRVWYGGAPAPPFPFAPAQSAPASGFASSRSSFHTTWLTWSGQPMVAVPSAASQGKEPPKRRAVR